MTLSRIIGIGGMILGVFALASMGLNCLKYWAMPYGPGSISLRSTEPLRVSSAHAVTIPIAQGETHGIR